MAVRVVEVTIEGTMPLLQHRFGEQAEGNLAKNTRRVKVNGEETPRDKAEQVAYRLPTGELWHPGASISRALREAAGNHKAKGSRKSMKWSMGGAVICLDDAILLRDAVGNPLTTYEVDSRPVVIPSTKGRVMRHRPRSDKWQMRFTLKINTDLIDAAFVRQLLGEAGQQIGLGDYRPEKGGPMGTFDVIHWQE